MSIAFFHNKASQANSEVLPVSFSQEELWMLEQLEPGNPVNMLSATVKVNRWLTPDILDTCLHQLVQRHAILRTTFHLHQGRLLQVIAPDLSLSVSVIDLRQQAPDEESLPPLLARQAQEPFVLKQEPLLRCTLVLLPSEQSCLLLTLHRLICDTDSLALFVRELADLSVAAIQGEPLSLPPLPHQYAQVGQQQRDALSEEVLAERLAAYQASLADAALASPLPTDFPRPALLGVRAASYQITLPPLLTKGLRHLSQQYAVSMESCLTSALLCLLTRYTGQQDLCLPLLGPSHRSVENAALIGPCDNPLFIRTNLAQASNVGELLTLVERQWKTAQEQDSLPFEMLLKALTPDRTQGGATPFSRILLHLPSPAPLLPAGWTLDPIESDGQSPPFDLTLELHRDVDDVSCRLLFRPELFALATIQRLATHWLTLLEGMVADSTLALTRLPILNSQERHLLLDEWTATERSFPLEQSFAALFEAQVRRSPDSLAVRDQQESLTYRQLDQQANQLAHFLREHGVGPESLVALLAERSIPLLISILAVFKAGGAYLPLDPHHPEERLRRVLQQSGSQLALSSADYAHTLASTIEALEPMQRLPLLVFEQVPWSRLSQDPLPSESGPHTLVYVIYTSGSTGLPKGAMVEQRGMINHLYAKIEALELTDADIVAQTASQCFDISVWQMLAALLVGGSVRIYPDAIAHDPLALLKHLNEEQVTIVETVPSLLNALLVRAERQGAEHVGLRTLRWMIPTGEALPVELCRRWLRYYPQVPLLNAYGPTECSDDVTHAIIAEPPPADCRSIPIGTAIANMRLYVLDEYLQPQPIGISGELYVGGVGVGRGYRNDAQRTAEVFLADPFQLQTEARLYKTGDLGRYRADGQLEFLGRKDFQVKMRGFRIELGEIEALLNQHSGVQQAVVLLREDVPGEQRLVAYVQAQPGISMGTLKERVQQQVPAYMVPSLFIEMEHWPLTANGKLDRQRLPQPDLGSQGREESYVAPRLPIEEELVAFWEAILGVKPIGIKDDFFALGGNSLQAAELFERMEQAGGKRLALSTFFAGATIEQMARVLQASPSQEPDDESRAPLVVVQKGEGKTPFFFLHGQWRGGALYTLEMARRLGPEQPFYLLEPYHLADLAVPPSLEEMAAAHLETLRQVHPQGPYLLGGYCNGALIAYEMARQLHAQGQAVDLLLLIDPDAPARHRWVRILISRVCNVMQISQKKQFEWFLCIQHIYRYIRFSHYRQSSLAELLGNAAQREAEHKPRKSISAPLSLKLKALIPKTETLRQGYLNMYDWSAIDYAPDLYAGKVTFFWTSEEPWRPIGWQKIVKEKEGDVEIHMLPGNHITSRTEHLPVLLDLVRICVNKVQKNAEVF